MVAPGQRDGVAGLRSGEILAIFPGGRITVLDCIVTHLTATSYARGASPEAGSTVVLAETHKRHAFERFGDGAEYEFVPLAVESFGRSDKNTWDC